MKGEQPKARVLAVGGHSRNIGKTSLIVDLIRAFPEAGWTAVKITQHMHGSFADGDKTSRHSADEQIVALNEEHHRYNYTDTSRFLAAGAARALLLQVEPDRLEEGLALVWAELETAGNVILESNTALQFLKPSLCLVVLDPSRRDFKSSVQSIFDQADAFVLRSPFTTTPWQELPQRLLEAKPKFLQRLSEPFPAELKEFVRARFFSPANFE